MLTPRALGSCIGSDSHGEDDVCVRCCWVCASSKYWCPFIGWVAHTPLLKGMLQFALYFSRAEQGHGSWSGFARIQTAKPSRVPRLPVAMGRKEHSTPLLHKNDVTLQSVKPKLDSSGLEKFFCGHLNAFARKRS